MSGCSAKQADVFEDQDLRYEKEKSQLFLAIYFSKANVDLDADCGLLWYQATVLYATMHLEAFRKVVNYPTAGLPDHALVEDQSEDISTDVKFGVWWLEETQTFTELVSQIVTIEKLVFHVSA